MEAGATREPEEPHAYQRRRARTAVFRSNRTSKRTSRFAPFVIALLVDDDVHGISLV